MPYSAESTLEKQISPAQLTELSDDDGNGVRDTGVIAQAIADADGEINGYLATRYTVPLATPPDLIVRLSVDIALHRLHVRRGIEEVVRRTAYEDAVAILKRISTGVATLGLSTEPPKANAAGGQSSANTRVFTRDKMKDF